MKTQPVVPARIEFGETPFAPNFGDRYHPTVGALAQARHVFLGGNRLPERWAGRDRFTIAETGFGLGNNFIAAWDAWRADAGRCRRLEYVAIERHPPRRADLERAHQGSPLPALAAALVAAWPPLVPGLHAIDFEEGHVRLLLAFGDVADLLPEMRFEADAFFLDGFTPARNPAMWDARVMKALGRRAAPGASAATWSVARELRDGLTAAGFSVERAPGIGGKREITVARYEPRWVRGAAVRPAPKRDAVVVGAGLAGAFAARALADEGWDVTVLERRAAPALETSGNAGGIFHGTVHADDGPHARLLRAAALFAARRLRPLVEAGRIAGRVQGLLRTGGRDLAEMQALIERQQLPPDWVQALDAAAASELAGVRLPAPAWFFPGGGWVAPGELVVDQLRGLRVVTGAEVRSFDRGAEGWRLWGDGGALLAEAAVVVLANAADAQRLAALWSAPIEIIRGQVSGWRGAATPLRLPVAGDGYALPLADGGLLCGASQSPGDPDPDPRPADEALNYERLRRLTGLGGPPAGSECFGRVGWRLVTPDRQPIAGALPQAAADGRCDRVRLWPRVEGLYIGCALGGRGITLAPVLGRLLAAQIAGGPFPIEQSLVDVLDPARWRVRQTRLQAGQA